MTEKKLYTCDYCNTSYADRNLAKQCEHNHKLIKTVKDTRYLSFKSDNTGRPSKICVEFEDGTTEWYAK